MTKINVVKKKIKQKHDKNQGCLEKIEVRYDKIQGYQKN